MWQPHCWWWCWCITFHFVNKQPVEHSRMGYRLFEKVRRSVWKSPWTRKREVCFEKRRKKRTKGFKCFRVTLVKWIVLNIVLVVSEFSVFRCLRANKRSYVRTRARNNSFTSERSRRTKPQTLYRCTFQKYLLFPIGLLLHISTRLNQI